MLYTIKSGYYSAAVNTVGAELVSLKYKGKEYMWQGNQWPNHAPVLFPIVARVNGAVSYAGVEYNLPKHGFIKNREFTVREQNDSMIRLEYVSDNGDYEIYPFRFVFSAVFTLAKEGLKVDFEVESKDEKPMLHQFGWHPAFVLFGDGDIGHFTLDFGKDACPIKHLLTEAKFVSGAISSFPLDEGKYALSEEEIYTEDTIILSETEGRVELSSPDTPERLILSYSDNLPYIAIWKWPLTEARYLCLEPWCGIPSDGVSKEVLEKKVTRVVAPGGREVYSYLVECK